MGFELYNTSVPRGLKPGDTGFCTVALTGGMSPAMIHRLESLSGYEAIFKVGSPDVEKNPVLDAHWRPTIGGQTYSVFSHVRFAGADFTGRTNRFAYHLLLEPSEQAPGGPAWLMLHPGVVEREWTGEPRVIPFPKRLPAGPAPVPSACRTWAQAAGDAGWAGVLAESFLLNAETPAYVVYELGRGIDLLQLVDEALRLLPVQLRWRVTFSTYFRSLPAGLSCAWRFCVAGTEAALAARRAGATIIDLTSKLGRAPSGTYAEAARTGRPAAEPDVSDSGLHRAAALLQSDPALRKAAAALAVPERAEEPVKYELVEEDAGEGRAPGRAARAGGSPAPHARRTAAGSRSLIIAVSLLWPLVALAVGGILLRRSAPSDAELVAAEAEADGLREEIERQRARVRELEKRERDADARADRADLEAKDARTAEARERARRVELEGKLAELQARPVALTPPPAENGTAAAPPVAEPAPAPAESPVAQVEGARELADHHWFVPYPRLKPDASRSETAEWRTTLLMLTSEGALRIVPAIEAPYLRFTPEKTGALTAVYKVEKSDAVGQPRLETTVLVLVALEDGGLAWTWREIRFADRSFDRDDLSKAQRALEYALIVVGAEPDATRVQMVPPHPAELRLGKTDEAAIPHAWEASDPHLEIAATPARWRATTPTGDRVRVQLTGDDGARLDFSIRGKKKEKTGDILLGSTFPEVHGKLARDRPRLSKEIEDLEPKIKADEEQRDKWAKRLKNIEDTLDEKEKRLSGLDRKDPKNKKAIEELESEIKELKGKPDSLRALLEEAKKRVVERARLDSERKVCEAQLAELEALRGLRLQVIAGSGAILANVDVEASRPEEEGKR